MADLSELSALASLVEVLDAAVRGGRTAPTEAETASRRPSADDYHFARSRMRSDASSPPSHHPQRELVVAEVVQW